MANACKGLEWDRVHLYPTKGNFCPFLDSIYSIVSMYSGDIHKRICNYWMKTVFLLRNVKTGTRSDWQCFVINVNFSTVER